MRQRPRILYLAGLSVLAAALLPACQRASYSFQPAKAAPAAFAALPHAAAPAPLWRSEMSEEGLYRQRRILRHHKPAVAARQQRAGAIKTAQPVAARGQQRPTVLAHYQIRKQVPGNAAQPDPVRHRSKAIALILAVLLGPFGVHRFYLGYYAQGVAYLGLSATATLFFLLGVLSLLFSTASLSGFFIVALLLSLAINIWLVFDIVRIITNDLLPKDGDY